MASLSDNVATHMSSPVYSVVPNAKLVDVRDRLLELGITSLAVVNGKKQTDLVGIVTRSDLFRVGHFDLKHGIGNLLVPDSTVASVMSVETVRVKHDLSISAAAKVMVDHQIHRVFVEDSTGVVGVLSTRDVMRVIAGTKMNVPLFEVMSYPVSMIPAHRPIKEAVEMMTSAGISGLVVIDQGWPCGVFTQQEAIAADLLPADATVEDALNPAMLVLPMDTPLHRAAANASSLDVRRVIASRGMQVAGIASGIDFCRAAF